MKKQIKEAHKNFMDHAKGKIKLKTSKAVPTVKLTPKKKFKWVTFEPYVEFDICFWTHKPKFKHGIWENWYQKSKYYEFCQVSSCNFIHDLKPGELRRINK